ncbi:MAG: glycosyltransferase family 1 protein [Patescibacteria group bacterium]
MKTYGIDAHLLLRENATGVPRYAWFLLREMMKASLADDERVVLYGHLPKPKALDLVPGWSWKVLSWPIPRGWTHGRLSLEMMISPPTVLFVPGHEVPMFFRKSTNVVTTLHDVAFAMNSQVYDPASRQRQEFAVQNAIRRAKILLTPSNATKADLESHYHVASDRIVVTPLAPTTSKLTGDATELLRKLQITSGQYILSISRLEKKKNTVLLIRAFAALKRKYGAGSPYVLVLAGSFGYGEQEIRRAIEEEKIADSVRLPGYISDDDASKLFAHAMCFAFPSVAEGFGIPVLEAMEHGAPVVASNIAVMREVCGQAAILVSPNDVAALSSAIDLTIDAETREEYRSRGFVQVQKFSWETTAAETWKALRSAASVR